MSLFSVSKLDSPLPQENSGVFPAPMPAKIVVIGSILLLLKI
jgi:hypothetical protein